MKNISGNAVVSFLLSLLSMMVVAFCYYYVQKSIFTMGVMIAGIAISCNQACKCLKTLKKSN